MEINKKNILGMTKNNGATSFMGVTKLQAITYLKIKWHRFTHYKFKLTNKELPEPDEVFNSIDEYKGKPYTDN